jgi:hypothetical protein
MWRLLVYYDDTTSDRVGEPSAPVLGTPVTGMVNQANVPAFHLFSMITRPGIRLHSELENHYF